MCGISTPAIAHAHTINVFFVNRQTVAGADSETSGRGSGGIVPGSDGGAARCECSHGISREKENVWAI